MGSRIIGTCRLMPLGTHQVRTNIPYGPSSPPALGPFLYLVAVWGAGSTIRELRDRVAEHYGKEAVQLTLYLPKRQSTDGQAATPPEAAQAGYKSDLDEK